MAQASRARRADKPKNKGGAPALRAVQGGKTKPASRTRWVVPLVAVGICTVMLIAYANSVGNGFVWDDNQQIVMNPDLRAGAPWLRLFSSDVWGFTHQGQPTQSNYYRPLQMVTYRLVAGWFGFEARAFHATSLLFALATVLAAWYVFFRLTRRPVIAAGAAVLFALQPVHTEAVDWISALPELGCTFFVLLGFGLFLETRDRPSNAPLRKWSSSVWLLWAGSLGSFAAALLWKETAMVLPLLVAAYVFFFEADRVGTRLRRAIRFSLPYWCVLAVYVIVRVSALGFFATSQRIWNLSAVQLLFSDLHLLMLYWGKLIAPVQLNAYHVFVPVRSSLDMRGVGAMLFAAVLLAGIWYGFRRHGVAGFAALWVCITLLPVMNIYALGRNVFAERYLYLPSAGWCLLVSLAIAAATAKMPAKAQRLAWAVFLLLVVGWYAAGTYARNPAWKDDATLFRQALTYSPDAPFVHFMVAATEPDSEAGRRSAEEHYLRAIGLAERENPPDALDLARTYEGLASLYMDRGDHERALQMVRQWRAIAPADPGVDAEEGLVLLKAGRWQDAEPPLQRASAARPDNENVLNALGLLAWQYKRDPSGAATFFRRALQVHSAKDDFGASLHNNLGAVYGELQQFPSAIEQLRLAVEIAPGDPEYHANLASALAASGDYDAARTELITALRIAPDYLPAQAMLQQLSTR